MNKNKIAIFDLDGTLVDTDASNEAAYRHALGRFGINDALSFYGRVSASVVRSAMKIADDGMESVIKAKVERYCRELWRSHLGPAAEILRFVLVNRSAFDKVVLLTDSIEQRAFETLNHHGLTRHFDEIVCNGGKGDKYANYFNAHDSNPAACVVWENENKQIMSAIAAGVKMENIRKVG